ncbi:MAG: hypothetical protein KBA06_02540 [Saprospiraceae bacterium]|nr:hypothetical protein [Saprospiraceae bacterium]
MDYKNTLFFIRIIIILHSVMLPSIAFSQRFSNLSNLVRKEIDLTAKVQVIDTLPVFPSSFLLYDGDTLVSKNRYLLTYTYKKCTLRALDSSLYKKVTIIYRTIPNDLAQLNLKKDSTFFLNRPPSVEDFYYQYNPFQDESNHNASPFSLGADAKGIEYNGSYARGLSFGNNQNLSLNSNFNLQMNGNLGNDIEISAALTDNNIPIQPEGNTRQLQEFDKIYIQLKHDQTKLLAGDFEQGRPQGYFMNYYKKMQGALVSHKTTIGANTSVNLVGGIAIARGKFARNTITSIEGNQGPYKLLGNDGERYIIILANTERIYIDGIQLQRGVDADYIIDYNRGDITFTVKRLITKDVRIIAEFEYVDQNYLRSTYLFQGNIEHKKLKGYINYFSEQDSKTNTNSFELDSHILEQMRNAGDSPTGIFVNGVDTLEALDASTIRYKYIDTLVNGFQLPFRILVLSSNVDSAIYSAKFTEVGIGKGNYTILNNGLSGRVYTWVAPDPITGLPTGAYEPVVRIIPPKKQELFTSGIVYNYSKENTIQSEIALSRYDLNRYSSLNSNDDVGWASYSKLQHIIPLSKDKNPSLIRINGSYELVNTYFTAVAPYRSAEFNRDWNTIAPTGTVDSNRTIQQLVVASAALEQSRVGNISYSYGFYNQKNKYQGNRQELGWLLKRKIVTFQSGVSILESTGLTEKGSFIRPKANLTLKMPFAEWLSLNGVFDQEINTKRAIANNDSLLLSSYAFESYTAKISAQKNEKGNLSLSYLKRNDLKPENNELKWKNSAEEYGINGSWAFSNTQSLTGGFTYRTVKYKDSIDVKQTYLGRIDYQLATAKGAIRWLSNYEIGSGQEQKVNYTFEPVYNGQGNYFFVADYNGDGLKQINEFEQVPLGFTYDTTYIRLTILTNEFIRTNNVLFNQSLSIDPRIIWQKDSTFVKKFLSKWSIQSNWRILRRVKDFKSVSQWNPFDLNVIDTALVVLNNTMRHNLTFNRAHPVYDLQYNFTQNKNRNILVSGYESRANIEHQFQIRYNVKSNIETKMQVGFTKKLSESQFFENQHYQINTQYIQPQLSYYYKTNIRISLFYKNSQSKNILGNEKSNTNDLKLEVTYNRTSQNAIRANMTYAVVKYEGNTGTPTQFAILDGLQNGQNYLWNLNFDQSLGRNMILSFGYEGRKTGTSKIVHIGRAQVRANF